MTSLEDLELAIENLRKVVLEKYEDPTIHHDYHDKIRSHMAAVLRSFETHKELLKESGEDKL